jgi:hypothetical protein
MKRILLLFLLILLVGCEEYSELVDCKDNDQIGGICVDLTKPTFAGVEDITIYKGDNFGPMINVFAEDDLDGNITHRITYDGNVNRNEPGTYLVTYKVSDLAGNETIALRYVTVEINIDDTTGSNIIWNGSFNERMLGWSVYQAEEGSAEFSIVDDSLQIEVTKITNGIPWQPRLEFQGLTIAEGKTYIVSFKIKSESDSLFQVQIGELLPAEPWFTDFNGSMNKQFLSTTEYTTHTFTFTMGKDTTNNGCILFEFGGLSAGHELTTFTLDDVSIKLIN